VTSDRGFVNQQQPPDIVLIGCGWPERALLRAQLIEEGYNVVALDAWPMPREYRRPGMKPRVLVVDLRELPHPHETLDEVRFVMPADRVLIVTALGTPGKDEVQRLGFRAIERPTTVGEIVAAAARLTRVASQQTGGSSLAPSPTKLGRVVMRKQDRIAQSQQQSNSKPEPPKKSGSEPKPGEDMKGSGSSMSRPPQHPREPGKLPLPD